jgi:hypothetical protein
MTQKTASPRSESTELRIVVWQFVRIMVQLEAVARSRGRTKAPSVYADWRTAWTEIDRTLERLGQSDAEAFSDLMMNQEVVLRCRDRGQVTEVLRAVENVMNQIDQQLRAVAGDGQAIEDLRFERRELNALAKKLRGQGRAGGRGSGRAPARASTGAPKRAAGAGGGGRSSPPRRSRKRKAP